MTFILLTKEGKFCNMSSFENDFGRKVAFFRHFDLLTTPNLKHFHHIIFGFLNDLIPRSS